MDDSTPHQETDDCQTMQGKALDKAIHTAKVVYTIQEALLKLDAGEEA